MAGWLYAKELEEAQFEILRTSELHQEQRLAAAARKASESGPRTIMEGALVLAARGGLGGRPKGKLQSRFQGPYLVIDRLDPASSLVSCQHLGTKIIENFHMSDLVVVKLDHLSEEELSASALQDHWTYQVESVTDFKPVGPRRIQGRLRPKSRYQFLVRYDLPLSEEVGDENPAWQPWANVRHLQAFKTFCARPDIQRQLGDNFYVSDEAGDE